MNHYKLYITDSHSLVSFCSSNSRWRISKLIQPTYSADTLMIDGVFYWWMDRIWTVCVMVTPPDLFKCFVDGNWDFIEKHKTDGVDIGKDRLFLLWLLCYLILTHPLLFCFRLEYPGKQAAGYKSFDENDTNNSPPFLLKGLPKQLQGYIDGGLCFSLLTKWWTIYWR